jgi:hypothetical protein
MQMVDGWDVRIEGSTLNPLGLVMSLPLGWRRTTPKILRPAGNVLERVMPRWGLTHRLIRR